MNVRHLFVSVRSRRRRRKPQGITIDFTQPRLGLTNKDRRGRR